MTDPFQTLGIPSSASEEEIKSAYHRLAKKYHPDLHPGDRQAEAKMKEINEAYAEAMRIRKGGGSTQNNPYASWNRSGWNGGNSSSYGQQQSQWGQQQQQNHQDPFGSFWDFGFGAYSQRQQQQQRTHTYTAGGYDDPELQAAASDIAAGRYQDARSLLGRMTSRGAAWHYLSALCAQGMGQRMEALNHARQAVQLDPSNSEYQSLLQSLQNSGGFYRSSGGQRTIGDALCSNPFLTCIGANLLLNCLCGRSYFMCC